MPSTGTRSPGRMRKRSPRWTSSKGKSRSSPPGPTTRAVSGVSATNASGQANGAFDSLIRFPVSNLVATVDSAIGSQNWVITRATLHLTEFASPPSALFNRGVGAFDVRWIANDNWIEGTGTPSAPATDGVKYQDLAGLLNGAIDASLGRFTNSGLDGGLSFNLALAPSFLADVRSGTRVSLYLTAASPQIGFTIDSRSNGGSSNWPALEITATARPNARIASVVKTGPNQLTISFATVSNWVNVLQSADNLSFNNAVSLLAVPAQSASVQTNFQDTVAGGTRFYRLSLAP